MTLDPKRWHTREDSGIRLDSEGRWWHDGALVEHPGISQAFDRGLAPAEGGRYTLTIGKDWCFVQVEGAAYRVLRVDAQPDGPPVLELSDGSSETLVPATLDTDAVGALTSRVKQGRALARFSRQAQVSLGELFEPAEEGVWLRCGKARVQLKTLRVAG